MELCLDQLCSGLYFINDFYNRRNNCTYFFWLKKWEKNVILINLRYYVHNCYVKYEN